MIRGEIEGAELLTREIRRLSKNLGMSTREAADHAAATAQKMTVRNVQPFGLSGKARKEGEEAVKRDIAHTLQMVPDTERGKKGVIGSVAEAERHHESQRNSRGRTNRRSLKNPVIASVYWALVAKKVKRVGSAKRSFAEKSGELGNRFQNWLKVAGKGSVKKQDRFGRRVWTFSSDEDHAAKSNVFGQKGVIRVLGKLHPVLKRSMQGKIRRQMKKSARRSGARVRG